MELLLDFRRQISELESHRLPELFASYHDLMDKTRDAMVQLTEQFHLFAFTENSSEKLFHHEPSLNKLSPAEIIIAII